MGKQIVVARGGFAGLYAVRALRRILPHRRRTARVVVSSSSALSALKAQLHPPLLGRDKLPGGVGDELVGTGSGCGVRRHAL